MILLLGHQCSFSIPEILKFPKSYADFFFVSNNVLYLVLETFLHQIVEII